MIEKVVELIRRFQPMSARSWEWDVLMTGSGLPERWHEIENEHRVLIIADPGAGKAFEACDKDAAWLRWTTSTKVWSFLNDALASLSSFDQPLVLSVKSVHFEYAPKHRCRLHEAVIGSSLRLTRRSIHPRPRALSV